MNTVFMNKKPLIILTGPTGVGKTALSIKLAKAVGGEIISADSMQVYQHMDIGTAKIRKEEMEGVPHYLIDTFPPTKDFNITLFQEYGKKYINEIYEKGKIPILVGGTGFYIQSILYDINFTEYEEESEEEQGTPYRLELEKIAGEHGNAYLHSLLKKVDETSYQAIHPNNVKKVIRALEYYKQTGSPISIHNEEQRNKTSFYQEAYFVLTDERQMLYNRIDKRVDTMIEEGLVEEVQNLLTMGCEKDMVSMKGLGYKEIISYLEGEITLEEAIYILKRDTRHFAKRQLTWFRREKEVIWVDKSQFERNEDMILAYLLETLKDKKII